MFSDTENRYLKQKPEFSLGDFLDGSFGEEYEAYLSDQFPRRDFLVAFQAGAQKALGKGDVNGVYFGRGGWYIERFDREKMENGQLRKNVDYLAQAVSGWQGMLGEDHVRVLLVPSASQILTERLPAFAAPWDQSRVYDMLAQAAGQPGQSSSEASEGGEKPWLLRPDRILWEHRAEEIYYRTDHHWTTRGAYYGFCLWMESAGMEPPGEGAYRKETATEEFLGTIHSKLNLPMEPDRIELWMPKTEAAAGKTGQDSLTLEPEAAGAKEGQELEMQMQMPEGQELGEQTPGEAQGSGGKERYTVYYDGLPTPHKSLYEPGKLEGRDKYAVFLDGNHALTEIVNERPGAGAVSRRLLIVKDSYAHCFAPFAAPYFERVYMADLRYFNQKLSAFIEEQSVTDILVLYQIPGFAADENVTKIAR